MESEYSSAWQQPAEHLRAVSAAGEDLLRNTAEQAGEEFQRSKRRFESALSDVRQLALNAEEASLRKMRLATAKTDLYVKEHPWQAMGYGAVSAGLAGVILGWLISRR